MPGHGRPLLRIRACRLVLVLGSVVMGMWGASLLAAPPDDVDPLLAELAQATPQQDDAHLRDVQFVGRETGWAVGDHGVIWHTRDGGARWHLQHSGVDCSLRSVCFLTDRVGWAVGGTTTPFTHISSGVLLTTNDGGETWRNISPAGLPELHSVQFFTLDHGCVAGAATDAHPTGVLSTEDGGKTWRDLPGPRAAGWRAAAFRNPESGCVVGARGSLGDILEAQVRAPRFMPGGTRGIADVVLPGTGPGWLVGDGGLVLTTENSGVVWQAPLGPLPEAVRDVFDFRAVSARGEHVWLAGAPGSTIWHSSNSGRTWAKQATGQAVPLSALYFVSDTHGWAVGELGTILRTEDGGQTWSTVRGRGRRLAWLALPSDATHVTLNLAAQYSADLGYRGRLSLLARGDIGQARTNAAPDTDLRLDDAAVRAGASGADICWRFPLAVPGLDRDRDRLLNDWNRRTEGRLEEILVGHLVRELRMWRPSVLLLDQPAEKDALGDLVLRAALQAVDQSADATTFLQQRELADLQPWTVQKVYLKLPPGSTGNVHVDPFEYLPRLGNSVQTVAVQALGRLVTVAPAKPVREAYRLIGGASGQPDSNISAGNDLFAGLQLAPGTAARRDLLSVNEDQLTRGLQVARQMRNFNAYVDRFLHDDRHAQQLLGQMGDILKNLTAPQAALQMAQIAEAQFRAGQWDLAELTLLELIDMYPDQPAAQQAAQHLIQFWGSSEIIWQRVQKSGTEVQRIRPAPAALAQRLQQAAARLQEQSIALQRNQIPSEIDAGPLVATADFIDTSASQRERPDEKFEFWRDRALRLAKRLHEHSPQLSQIPEIRFSQAAVHRQRHEPGRADEIYRQFANADAGSPWHGPAISELWLSNPVHLPPRAYTLCGRANRRPVLDGILSDPCWEIADEIVLRAAPDETPDPKSHPFAMLSFDDEYLYIAASVPFLPDQPRHPPVTHGRRHDDDLQDFDRITILLDTDRDYTTYYSLTIDQRGCTADACWQDTLWNPRWFVAADVDDTHWRIEAAIPLRELVPQAPASKSVWAAGIVRTIPAIGLQGWTHPAATPPRPETFGLVRFE